VFEPANQPEVKNIVAEKRLCDSKPAEFGVEDDRSRDLNDEFHRLKKVDEKRKLPERRHRRLVVPLHVHRSIETVDLDPRRNL